MQWQPQRTASPVVLIMFESFAPLSKRSDKHSPLLITLASDLWIHQRWHGLLIHVYNGSKMPIIDHRPGLFLVWLKWNQCWTQMLCLFDTALRVLPCKRWPITQRRDNGGPVQKADDSQSSLFPSYLLPHCYHLCHVPRLALLYRWHVVVLTARHRDTLQSF